MFGIFRGQSSKVVQSSDVREIGLIMHSFTLMVAVSPSLEESVFEAASRRKEIMQEPDPPNHAGRSPFLKLKIANQ